MAMRDFLHLYVYDPRIICNQENLTASVVVQRESTIERSFEKVISRKRQLRPRKKYC